LTLLSKSRKESMDKDIAFKSKPRLKKGSLVDIELSDKVFKTGRPLIVKNPKEMEDKFVDYLQWCEENSKPLTRSGMTLFLGFSSIDSLRDYEKKPEFSDLVKTMLTFIESYYEEMGQQKGSGNFPIFALKQFGWSDYRKVEHKHESRSLGAVLVLTDESNSMNDLVDAEVEDVIKKKITRDRKKKHESQE